MNRRTVVMKTAGYFAGSNLAVALACAVATAVLTGALLVGDSMRGSLRALTLERLGRIEEVMVTPRFFRADLPARLPAELGDVAAVIIVQGSVENPAAGRSIEPARNVTIIGTSPEFFRLFSPIGDAPALASQTRMNAELAESLYASAGEPLIVRFEKMSSVPREGMLGNREDVVGQLRLVPAEVIPNRGIGRFSLVNSPKTPKLLFVPLERLAAAIEQPGRANALLASSGPLAPALAALTLDDMGLTLRADGALGYIALESRRLVIEPSVKAAALAAADALSLRAQPVMTYLANAIRIGERSVPYSVVAACKTNLPAPLGPIPAAPRPVELRSSEMLLNEWAAADLGAKLGDKVRLEYYQVAEGRRPETTAREFRLVGIVPITGLGADRHFAPDYPGISDKTTFGDWTPPFPIDLGKVRKKDEEYWRKWRTTPKGFLALEDGERMWGSRFGQQTSIRFAGAGGVDALAKALRARLSPESLGFAPLAIRQLDLEASEGSTDFHWLFLGFSFFLMASAVLLVTQLFRLNIERRAAQVGLYFALGFPLSQVRRLLLAEGLAMAGIGGMIGLAGAAGYASLMVRLLATWWRGAVGTSQIAFHATAFSFIVGGIASIAVALLAMFWATRSLSTARIPSLLRPGFTFAWGSRRPARWSGRLAMLGLVMGAGAALVGAFMSSPSPVLYFVAGCLFLSGGLSFFSWLLRQPPDSLVHGTGWRALARLGIRNAGRYPARSVLTSTLIALATFVLVTIGALSRAESSNDSLPPGAGGYTHLAETDVPIFLDLGDPKSVADLGLPEEAAGILAQARPVAFRVKGGDDASCLNIYQPREPRLLGVPGSFIDRGGFVFSNSIAESQEERANPWKLLDRTFSDGAIPAIGDANTLQWILKKKVGSELSIRDESGKPLTLRIVAALSGSIFQGELLIGEEPFRRAFPSIAGARFFLFAPPAEVNSTLAGILYSDLNRYGVRVQGTAERLAEYRAVENTYMAAFGLLGGLGLLLGTLGLGAVLYRQVLERQGELALLRALGFRRSALATLIVAENLFLVLFGLAIGGGAALVASAPAILETFRHTHVDDWGRAVASLVGILFLTAASGLLGGLAAVVAVLRIPLLSALRRE